MYTSDYTSVCVHGFTMTILSATVTVGLLHAHVHACTCTCMYYGLSRLRANNMSGNEGLLKIVGSKYVLHDSTVCACVCVSTVSLKLGLINEELKCVHAYEGAVMGLRGA